VAVVVVIIAILACYTFLTHDKQQTQLAQIQAEQQQVQQEAEEKKAAEEKEAAEKEEEEKKAAEEKEAEEKEEAASASEPTTINNYYYYNTGNPPGDYYTDVKSSGYLWPTDTQYITSSDLSGFDKDTVAAIRNEIYARHGYAFQQTRWQEYFAAKSWYYRDESCTESTVSSRLNSVEKTNIDTIVKYEKSMGWR
jgi:flagellar biosynthesis GTPase FlhF